MRVMDWSSIGMLMAHHNWDPGKLENGVSVMVIRGKHWCREVISMIRPE